MKKKLRVILTFSFVIVISGFSNAQLSNGSIASNFTFNDLNANVQDLYTYLNAGKTVFVNISSTWCPPCWSFHTSKSLDSMYTMHGPLGMTGVLPGTTNDVMVLFIENDITTNTACLHGVAGCNSTTQGDWVSGTSYPICDNNSALMTTFNNNFKPVNLPVLYMICPDKRVINCSPAVIGTYNMSYYYGLKQQNCFAATAANDASLHNTFQQRLASCDSVVPTLMLENNSTTLLTSCKIVVQVDGIAQKTINWVGSLATYASANINNIKIGSSIPGPHSITATVSNPNGGVDSHPSNDVTNLFFTVFNSTGGAAVVEGFQGATFPPANFFNVQNPVDSISWKSENVGAYGTSSQSAEMRFYNEISGNIDELVLPTQSFVGIPNPILKFDLAKAMFSNSYIDTLRIKVSKDCGTTWTTVYDNNDNATLNTAGAATSFDFSPISSQWITETVNLSSFGNQSAVIVKYCAISGNSNNLYIDNINIANAAGLLELNNISNVNLYPNPSSSQTTLLISLVSPETIIVNIYNNIGELVFTETINNMPAGDNKTILASDGLENGFYTLTISSKKGYVNRKLAVSK